MRTRQVPDPRVAGGVGATLERVARSGPPVAAVRDFRAEVPGQGFTLGISYCREEVAMCSGDRLVADFVAGTSARPDLPGELDEHLTTTVDGLWVVWAHKLAWQAGDQFLPLTGGSGYPADARASLPAPGRSRRSRSGVHVRLPRPVEPEVAGAAGPRRHGADRCPVRAGAGLRLARRRSAVAGGAADRGPHRTGGSADRGRCGGWACPPGQKQSSARAAIPMIPTAVPLSSPPPHLAIRGRCG